MLGFAPGFKDRRAQLSLCGLYVRHEERVLLRAGQVVHAEPKVLACIDVALPSFETLQSAQHSLRVGPYTLQTFERELTCSGRVLPIQARAFDCLVILARSRRVVSQQRLIAAL